MLSFLARMGTYWYVAPCLLVVIAGLATCSLVDETDFDTFHVESSLPDKAGVRSAVVVRQQHADSGATMKCVWIIPGPPPSAGNSPRLSPSCALVDTHPDAPLTLAWLANGRLGATVPAGVLVAAEDERNQRCYFSKDRQRRVICYRSELIDIEQPKPGR